MDIQNKTPGQVAMFVLGIVFMVGVVSLVSSAITLIAVNTLFGLSLDVEWPQIFSLAWLQVVVGGLIRQAKSNG